MKYININQHRTYMHMIVDLCFFDQWNQSAEPKGRGDVKLKSSMGLIGADVLNITRQMKSYDNPLHTLILPIQRLERKCKTQSVK